MFLWDLWRSSQLGLFARTVPDFSDEKDEQGFDVHGMSYRHAESDDSGWLERGSSWKSVTKYWPSHTRELDSSIGALNRLVQGG